MSTMIFFKYFKIEQPCSAAVLPVFHFSLDTDSFGLSLCFSGNLILLIPFSKVAFNRFPDSTFCTETRSVFFLLSTRAVILGSVMWSWKWGQWCFSPTVHKVHCINVFYCSSRSLKKVISHRPANMYDVTCWNKNNWPVRAAPSRWHSRSFQSWVQKEKCCLKLALFGCSGSLSLCRSIN